jgi:hypothetical protein
MSRLLLGSLLLLLHVVSEAGLAADQRFTATETADGVLIREGERNVLFYQRKPKSQDGRFRRANYVHPLHDLDGRVITEDFPPDHRHHRGIYWAWHQLWVGDRQAGDGWMAKDFDWDVQTVEVRDDSPAAMSLKLHVVWTSPEIQDAAGKSLPLVDERTVIRMQRSTESQRLLDFEIRLTALQPDMRLGGSDDEKGYGGFSVRVPLPKDLQFVGTDGPVEPQASAVAAGPWLNLAADSWGLAILQDPRNPGFPQPWILRRERSMQNPAWPGRNPVPFKPGEPVVLRYRLVLHRGELEPPMLDRLQRDYAERSP